MNKKNVLFVAVFAAIGIVLTVLIQKTIDTYTHTLISPVSILDLQQLPPQPPALSNSETPALPKDFVRYGFVPYWTSKQATIAAELTHVAYFSLEISPKGSIVTKTEDGTEMGWHTFQSTVFEKLYTTAQKQNQQLEIVLTMMDADDISAFLLSKDAQKNFYDTMKQLVLAEPISGINIDIEYAGTVTPQLKNAYTAFIQTLADEVRSKNPDIKIRIDVFGEAALKERIWDIPKLGAIVDSIIVMAYDYHRTSSPIAGPVAPIFGSEQKLWSSDIALCLKAFLETVPPEKIILGIPLYGYEWQTTSHERGATTYPKTGALATYKRVAEIIRSPPENTLVYKRWDPQALSPYLTLEETIGKKKEIRTIYYEDARSLRYKLQLAQQAKLGGVAFWAIGYEGNNPDIWQIFK